MVESGAFTEEYGGYTPCQTQGVEHPKMLYHVTWDSRAPTPDIAVTAGIHYVDYTSAADDNKINVTFAWPAGATTGWTCRVWLVWNYYGPRADQYIDVAHPATTCSFDKFGIAGSGLSGTGRVASTGATLWNGWASGGQSWWTVRAYNASGVGPESVLTSGVTAPYHPMYLEWHSVSGATGYILTQYLNCTMDEPDWGVGVTPLRTWDVGNVTSSSTIVPGTWPGSLPVDETTETPTKGIPVRHVGQLADSTDTLWEAWLVCGHAVTSVDAVYIDHVRVTADVYGAELAVPGQTGFSTSFGARTYRDLNGARYTLRLPSRRRSGRGDEGFVALARIEGARQEVALDGVRRGVLRAGVRTRQERGGPRHAALLQAHSARTCASRGSSRW